MLIYNNDKKLIGIDEEDLETLGFKHVEALLGVCEDIAELFVKKPGYIYDFKNFEWIDFVLNADAEVSKVMIQTSRRHFTCDIAIKPFYMIETPDKPAYAVYLQHIHSLGSSETAAAEEVSPESAAPVAAPTPPSEPVPEPSIAEPVPEPVSFEAPAVSHDEPTFQIPENEPVAFDSPVSEIEDEIPAAFAKPLEIEDDLFMEPVPEPVVETLPELKPATPAPAGIYTLDEQEYIDKLTVSGDYVFDPHIAADELGLPVDLIEEFVGDFTKQSHDFHEELFDSAAKSDFDNVKILSHKLKGVAANLRVEDALEMLTIINNSHDQIEIEANLKAFYRVIDKLEGIEAPAIVPSAAPIVEAEPVVPEAIKESAIEQPQEVSEVEDDDIYSFDLPISAPETTEPESVEEPIFEQPQEVSEAEDDDIYSFDLPIPAPETTEPESVEEPIFEQPQEVSEAEEAAEPIDAIETTINEEPAIDELYAPVPETAITDDDLYSVDALLTEPEPVSEETLPQENISANEYPDFNDDEVELPPMDMSFLNEPDVEPAAALDYDVNKAADEIGLPASLVHELQKDFAVEANACRSEFDEVIASSQVSEWQSCAATLKGAADNLRMTEIAEELKVLTQTDDQQQAEKSMQQLYSYVEQL